MNETGNSLLALYSKDYLKSFFVCLGNKFQYFFKNCKF